MASGHQEVSLLCLAENGAYSDFFLIMPHPAQHKHGGEEGRVS